MIDYYSILNIKPTASKDEIKKAFKIEALKWHPDKNNSPDATERMQLINEAYLILKDDEARERYDKQYFKFKETNYEKQSENQWYDYSSNDEILNDWIKKAKKQAKEMVIMSIDDLVGMSKSATSAAWNKIKYAILIVIILIISINYLLNNTSYGIDEQLRRLNNKTPIKIDKDIELIRVILDGTKVIFKYKLINIAKDDIPYNKLYNFSKSMKYILCKEKDLRNILNYDKTISIYYYGKYGHLISDITIDKQECR